MKGLNYINVTRKKYGKYYEDVVRLLIKNCGAVCGGLFAGN